MLTTPTPATPALLKEIEPYLSPRSLLVEISSMVNTLKACGIGPNRLGAIAGTTFKLQLLIAEALYQENYDNETSIMMDSKQSLGALSTFLRCGTRTFSTIRRKARRGLLQDLGDGRDYLAGDQMYGDAYGRFNAAVEASTFHRHRWVASC